MQAFVPSQDEGDWRHEEVEPAFGLNVRINLDT